MKPPLRLFAVLAPLAALVVLAIASVPSAAAGDKDCADFPTQKAAQTFFLKHGGPRYDPHRLDGDHDGIACEDNPCPCSSRQHLRPAARLASLEIEGDRIPRVYTVLKLDERRDRPDQTLDDKVESVERRLRGGR